MIDMIISKYTDMTILTKYFNVRDYFN